MRPSHHILKKPVSIPCKRFLSTRSTGTSGIGIISVMGASMLFAGGAIAYASKDKKLRKSIEDSLPGSKFILKMILDDNELDRESKLDPLHPLLEIEKKNEKCVKEAIKKPDEMKKLKNENPSVSPDDSSTTNETPKKLSAKKEITDHKTTHPCAIDDISKAKVNPYEGKGSKLEKNQLLTVKLKKLIIAAENATKEATRSKLEVIRAIENHAQTTRETVAAGNDGNWDAVTMAHLKAKRIERQSREIEEHARNCIAAMVTESNLGYQCEKTQFNPLLPICKETAKKLSNELDEMAKNVKKIDSDKIIVNEKKDLQHECSNKVVVEVKAARPEIEYDNEKSIKKSDLQTILSHAHTRIDQLSKQIIEMKLKEESRILEAVEKKKDQIRSNNHIKDEKSEIKEQKIPQIVVQPKIDEKALENEIKARTMEIQQKYDEKLREMVITQKQLYDIEHSKDIEHAVGKEREFHTMVIGKALSQITAIENALKGNIQMDIENRKAKQLWLATQNIVDSVKFGNRGRCCMEGRRAPLGEQLKTIIKYTGDDPFIKLVDKSISKETKVMGEYTCADLDARFKKAYRIGRRVAYVTEKHGYGLWSHLGSWARSILTIRLPFKKVQDKISLNSSNIDLLDYAFVLWKQGRRLDAIRILQLTTGATRHLCRDFIQDARRHEEALLLSRLLLAHSALSSIRSTY